MPGDEEESPGEAGCFEGLAGNALVNCDDDEWLSCLAFRGLSRSLLSGLEDITSLL